MLRRLGLGRLPARDQPSQIRRCDRKRPGELIDLDAKKLGHTDAIGHRIIDERVGESR